MSDVFRFEFFVEDKNVAAVMRLLNGKVIDMRAPVPVINAVTRNGRVAAETSGDAPDMLIVWAKKRGLRQLNAKLMMEFASSVGRKSYQSVKDQAIERGLLKANKFTNSRNATYKVL